MRAQDITSKPRNARYLNKTLTIAGLIAFGAGAYVAWPALVHLAQKIL
jgi:hypothetical protein